MQLNIKGLNDSELMNGGAGNLGKNIPYEGNFNKNLIEGFLPMLKVIFESDMITRNPNVIDNVNNESLNNDLAPRAPTHVINTQNT